MPEGDHSRGNTRVLSIVLHATHPGAALLDRFGVVDGGFRVLDVHHHRGMDARTDAVCRQVAQLVTGHRPAVVLIASSPSAPARMENVVRSTLRRSRVVAERADTSDARALVLGRSRGDAANALARRLVAGFTPELRAHVVSSFSGQRSRRPAWSALAVAITWLVRHRPRSAFAMAHAPAFDVPGLAAAIAEADRRIHPEPP